MAEHVVSVTALTSHLCLSNCTKVQWNLCFKTHKNQARVVLKEVLSLLGVHHAQNDEGNIPKQKKKKKWSKKRVGFVSSFTWKFEVKAFSGKKVILEMG